METDNCARCKKSIDPLDEPIVEDGKWYHLTCFKALLRRRIREWERDLDDPECRPAVRHLIVDTKEMLKFI